MKKRMIWAMLAACLVLFVLPPVIAGANYVYKGDGESAYPVTGGNIYYEEVYTFDNPEEEVIAIVGSDKNITTISIPHEIDGKPVQIIGANSFANCDKLVSVIIPNSVTDIGGYAFSGCISLNRIEIPDSVRGINSAVFDGCTSLKSIDIPTGVETISSFAFIDCTGLTSLNIPSSVTYMGDSIARGCDNLTSINVAADNANYRSVDGVVFSKDLTTLICYPGGKSSAYAIPDGVAKISSWAFGDCANLTNVTVPNSVTAIESAAFNGCSSLSNINIASSNVTTIGGGAFFGCDSLTSLTIPSSITSIEAGVFGNCNNLKSLLVAPDNSVYSSIDGVLFSNDMKTLVAFPSGRGGNYSIPGGVTTIGDLAFHYCGNLTSVTIPSSVSQVSVREGYAFVCDKLTDIYYAGGEAEWKTINSGASWLYNSNSITIHYNSTGPGTASGGDETPPPTPDEEKPGGDVQTPATSGTLPTGVRWSLSNGVLTFSGSGAIPDYNSHLDAPWDVFTADDTDVSRIIIGSGITRIGSRALAFYGRDSAAPTAIILPDTLQSIGDVAFGFTNLTYLEIPASVKSIGATAFDSSRDLTVKFLGDAPAFGISTQGNEQTHIFWRASNITIQYPAGNSTWDAYVGQNLSADAAIAWEAYGQAPTFDPDPVRPPEEQPEEKPSDKPVEEKPDEDTQTPAIENLPFEDVADTAWYYDAVKYVYERGIMNGTDKGFSPQGDTTRAMLWTMLARLDGVDTTGGSAWYEKGRQWAMDNGVSDGTDPAGNITREQLVVMLWRYAGSPSGSGDVGKFSDSASISNWAQGAMAWAVETDLVSGSHGALEPRDTATRAEMSTLMMRFCKLLGK